MGCKFIFNARIPERQFQTLFSREEIRRRDNFSDNRLAVVRVRFQKVRSGSVFKLAVGEKIAGKLLFRKFCNLEILYFNTGSPSV